MTHHLTGYLLGLLGRFWYAAALLIIVLFVYGFWQRVISDDAATRNRVRALRWRIRLRLRPDTGYASLAELLIRWSRLTAIRDGRRARPNLPLWVRLTSRTTQFAVRLGRAQYFRRAYARMEDQVLMLAPQRTGKSGLLADRIVSHPGAVLATSTRADLYLTTVTARSALGEIHVFNPQRVGDVRSTLRWDIIGPCRDLVMARRIATWLTGGTADSGHGNIEWFEQKGEVALAGLLFAAAVTGSTISDVFRWNQLDGQAVALKALAEHGTPEMLAVVRRMLEDNRTSGSIRDTIELALAWAAIPDLAAAVTPLPGDPAFDVEKFAFDRGTLYMIARGDENSPLTPVFRTLASYVHYQASLLGTRTAAGRLDPPLFMALDEAPVICPVDLPGMLADSAGYGILIMPVAHSISQLEDRWGEHGAKTIWSTCGTKLLLPGISDDDTLERVSRLCGSITAGDPDNGERVVRVVPPELIRALPNWRALVLRMNLSPVVVKFRPVWRRPEHRLPVRWYRELRWNLKWYLRTRPGPVDVPVPDELPGPVNEPAPVPDLVPAARRPDDTWPWDDGISTGGDR